MYELQIERVAEKETKRLPPPMFGRVAAAIAVLKESPRPHRAVKLAGSLNDWRIRIDDYRVIYEIDDEAKRVRV